MIFCPIDASKEDAASRSICPSQRSAIDSRKRDHALEHLSDWTHTDRSATGYRLPYW